MQLSSDYTTQPDDRLAQMASRKDRSAFAALYERHFQGVYDFIVRIVQDADLAADLVQTAFVKTWESLQRGRIPKRPKAWIYTLARNAAIDELRQRKRLIATDEGALERTGSQEYAHISPSRAIDPQAALEQKELASLVWRSAAALRPEEYTLLDLYLRRGLTADELAAGLGIRKGTLYTRLSRLKDSLEESVVASLLAQRGRRDCSVLDELLTQLESSELDREVRNTVIQHLETCDRCQENRARYASPAEIFGSLALIPAAAGTKQTIWSQLTKQITPSVPPPTALTRLTQWVARHKAVSIGAGLTILAIGGTSTWILVSEAVKTWGVLLEPSSGDQASIENPALLESSAATPSLPSVTDLPPTEDRPEGKATTAVAGILRTPTQTVTLTSSSSLTATASTGLTKILTASMTPTRPTSTPTITDTATITVPTSTQTRTPSPTMTNTPSLTPTFTPVPVVWEDDTFDGLATGSLNGQNGWSAVQDSPQVIPFAGKGKVLKVDPGSGRTILIGKNIPDQSGGLQRFEFDVMVLGATEASLAKIMMETNFNAGWDKKFQIYFGDSMRINYSGSGAAQTIVASTESGRWYHLRFDLDMGAGMVDVWVDGGLVLTDIPMHPGPLTALGISGWDRVGEVNLDNLIGSG